MVVGDGSRLLGFVQHFMDVIKQPADAAHTHGRSVATASVGLRRIAQQPLLKHRAVTARWVGIAVTPFAQRGLVIGIVQHGIGNGNGADGVVGETAFGGKQFERRIVEWGELESRTYNISNDGT